MNVDPKSTATMISGLVLCSIFAPYVYVGIKGIYRTCEKAHFEKMETRKAGRQESKQKQCDDCARLGSPSSTVLGAQGSVGKTAKSAVHKRRCNTIRCATAPGACVLGT